MKLSYLAKRIEKAAPKGMLSVNEFYASLDFRGLRNAHLAIPDWHTEEFRLPDMARADFLTGEEEIAGDVLVLCYRRNAGEMILHECTTLADAARLVMGGAGVFNGFTDLVLVFDEFELRSYRVSYRDHTGARAPWAGRHIEDDWPYPDRQLEWLGAVD